MSDRARHADRFFAYARERHSVYLRREAGLPEPWTRDKILGKYRFTNVFRELDRTTAWFKKYVRDPYRDQKEAMLATVVFRMFNRVEVGEAMFGQPDFIDGGTAFQCYLHSDDTKILRRAIKQFVGQTGPYATGAYIISSPPGCSKLDGILKIIHNFNKNSGWRDREFESMEGMWNWLRDTKYLGTFHSYEIATDMRHTSWFVGGQPCDIMEWCNVGPGARRGLNRVMGRPKGARVSTEQMLEEMRGVLDLSQLSEYWPQPHGDVITTTTMNNEIYLHAKRSPASQWPAWEMREVEHTLCEFDKMERVRLGEGRPRGVFR